MSFLMKLLEQLNPVGVAIIVLTFIVFVISFIINLVIRSRYNAIRRISTTDTQGEPGCSGTTC